MKTKDKQAFEKWARPIIDEYQRKLLLTHHHISIVSKTDNIEAVMELSFRVPYLDPELRYNPNEVERFWKRGDKNTLKHMLIHELCHIITDPLYGLGFERFANKQSLSDARETCTDHIAMIITKNKV